MAADIENTPNSIGYVEYSYLLLNPSLLKGVAAIVNKSGKAVTAVARRHRPRRGRQAEDLARPASRSSVSGARRPTRSPATPGRSSGSTRRPVATRDPDGQVPRLAVALGRQRRHRRPAKTSPPCRATSRSRPTSRQLARTTLLQCHLQRQGAFDHQRLVSGRTSRPLQQQSLR